MSKFDELITEYDYLFTKNYRIDSVNGVLKGHTDAETGEFVQNVKDGHVSSKPILPVAILDNLDSEIQKVEIAWWESGPSKWKRTVTNRETLVNNSKITKLADRGVPVGSDNARVLSTYFNTLLCEFDGKLPRKPARSVMGWCEYDDKLIFMPYTDKLGFDGADQYKAEYDAIRNKGTLDAWVERLEPLRVSMEVRLMMAASFASPLIGLVKENPFVFHLYGGSGSGKTVCILLAMSIWGDPEIGKLTKSLNTTVNAMMERGTFLNSLPFAGDELQTLKTRGGMTYDAIIMQITEGVNRGRMKNNELQQSGSWRNAWLFTGEEPVVKATSGGGVVNRCIQVEIKQPVFDKTGPDSGNKIANFARTHFGNAGRAYIERIQAINAGLAPVDYSVSSLFDEYYTELVNGDTTEKQAGAMALILTGDRIAHDLFWNGEADTKNHGEERLTPELVVEFLATKGQVDVAKRAYQYILGVIAENSLNFLGGQRVTWGKTDDDQNPTQIDFVKTVLDRVLSDAGFDFDAVKKRWLAYGYIQRRSEAAGGGYKVLTSINGMPTYCVRINLPKTEPEFTDHTGPTPFDAD